MAIRKRVLQYEKYVFTRLGSWMPTSWLQDLRISLNYMRLGKWMDTHGFDARTREPDHHGVFRAMADRIGDVPVLYMEFGVWTGNSMREWSRLLAHPDSQLHGFDSFVGLPELFDDRHGLGPGALDVGGSPPNIDDPRIEYHVGWFDEVLPQFKVPEHENLIVNVDCDLYSSTVLVLNLVEPHVKKGTILYFDDMSQPDHEPRAFAEFIERTGRQFRLLATDLSLNMTAFECVG